MPLLDGVLILLNFPDPRPRGAPSGGMEANPALSFAHCWVQHATDRVLALAPGVRGVHGEFSRSECPEKLSECYAAFVPAFGPRADRHAQSTNGILRTDPSPSPQVTPQEVEQVVSTVLNPDLVRCFALVRAGAATGHATLDAHITLLTRN